MSEITRKLATIQRVTALDPIEGADRIEVASVLGWKVVCQKGLYQVNDLVAFFEIDSFLPVEPQYEFLRKGSYRVTKDLGEGFRLKTVKLRGQISQGLLMPLHELGVVMNVADDVEGQDLTDLLRVQKWELNAQVLLSGRASGSFPHFVPKTDEPRVQNLGRERNVWADDDFAITIKEDGSSMTVFVDYKTGLDFVSETGEASRHPWRVGVASRNWEVPDEEGSTYWKVAKEIGLVAGLQQSGLGVAVQGELVGPGVQGNPGGYAKLGFKVFNIWHIENQMYLTTQERGAWIAAFNLLYKANVEEVATLFGTVHGVASQATLDHLIEEANVEAGHMVEGIVMKSVQHPERSYKYINPEYLLKDKD